MCLLSKIVTFCEKVNILRTLPLRAPILHFGLPLGGGAWREPLQGFPKGIPCGESLEGGGWGDGRGGGAGEEGEEGASLAGWPCLAGRWAVWLARPGAAATRIPPPRSYHRRWVMW